MKEETVEQDLLSVQLKILAMMDHVNLMIKEMELRVEMQEHSVLIKIPVKEEIVLMLEFNQKVLHVELKVQSVQLKIPVLMDNVFLMI